ncbi:MAG TPA: hypothetical protein VMZ53_01755 [Kofleriaceae bacterium]|nr:hypothetical protein [Kofleriaceae bacterium]
MRVQRISLALVLAFVGCGPSGGDHDDKDAVLTVDPPTAELLILDGTPATADFTAVLTYPDGETKDVTDQAHFAVDNGYGMMSGHTGTFATAGKTQVFASLSDKTAASQVIIRLKDIRIDPSLPPDAANWFTSPEDPSRAPTVVYPPANVVMPRNLGDFEVHWTDTANNVFEVSLKTEFTDVRAIVPGGNGAIASGSWLAFLANEWLAAVGYETSVQFQVRGVDKNNPTVVGAGAPQLVKLSNEAMLGGVYYWASTAQNGTYGIFRHDMGKPGQAAEQFMTTAQTGGRCVACHVLSRDGTRMSITYDGGNGAATLMDVGTKAVQASTRGWNFGAFTPDGAQFLAVQNGSLNVLDSSNQAVLATMTASGTITHPDLSADGKRLVYVQRQGGGDWSFTGGKVFTRTYDQASHTFGPEQMLVSDSNNNYYPSFSPDGKWVLFNRATGGDAYNNGNATLWVIPSDASAAAVQLQSANAGLGLTNSWGRWAPFQQTVGTEPIYWVTVSSTRNFGVRLVGANKPQIWMTPFYPNAASQQQDPSAAAFRLPFQNIDSNNHIAQWTEQIVAPQ